MRNLILILFILFSFSAYTQNIGVLPATTGAMTVRMGYNNVYTITPTGACTFNASGGVIGERCSFVVTTSGTNAFVLTWSANFTTTSTLSTGTLTNKKFCITFVCTNGTQWVETARTIAMN